MTNYDYKTAMAVLSQPEQGRLICCFLNSTDTNAVDWDTAYKEYGSASIGSFKKMVQTALKKIKDAEANGGAPATPAKVGGKKRKDATEDGDDAEALPKKRGKKAKSETPAAKSETPVAKNGDDAEESVNLKQEGSDFE